MSASGRVAACCSVASRESFTFYHTPRPTSYVPKVSSTRVFLRSGAPFGRTCLLSHFYNHSHAGPPTPPKKAENGVNRAGSKTVKAVLGHATTRRQSGIEDKRMCCGGNGLEGYNWRLQWSSPGSGRARTLCFRPHSCCGAAAARRRLRPGAAAR